MKKKIKIGIIGCGRIGQNLAKYFKAMSATVMVHDIDPMKVVEIESASNCTVDEILALSDLVITSVTLNESTRAMANTDFFRKMKPGAVYVNTSRGDVVDENALLYALKSEKISACALDVLSNENLPNFLQNNPLIKYAQENENLILTPHIAGLTIDSETKAQKAALELLMEII